MDTFTMRLNGRSLELTADGQATVLDVLRGTLGLTGTRFGCGLGQCGACFILIDGRPAPSCDMPVWSAAEHDITTVDGLDGDPTTNRLRDAFLAEQAAQCGYCVSGMLISAAALLAVDPHPDEDAVIAALDRNLCRCGSHRRIVRAVLRAAAAGA
ncbi:MAG TPA: 2Fe-2S iron-sulfur cluster-binding protein [Micromonosporaceae bacterium]